MLPRSNLNRTQDMLCLTRREVSQIVSDMTGHRRIDRHVMRINSAANNICRSCGKGVCKTPYLRVFLIIGNNIGYIGI